VKLVNVLEDVDVPGKLRKVGPSLRHVADKLDYDFLYSWVRRPQDFRPNTKMPQFFGLHKHLDHDSAETTQAWEQIEIQGVVEYLLDKSQKWDADDEGGNLIQQASVERGKHQFEVRGCLACHQHGDFKDAKMDQGPDLSRIGDKLARAANEKGSRWLYNWLRDPSKYHPRTLMPNLLLERSEDESGNVSDTAADIAAYLLKSGDGWQPKEIPSRTLTEESQQNLDKVALEHLRAVFTKSQAEQYAKHGIPTARARELKGDEIELLGDNLNPAEVQRKKLVYVGRRTISKYGCSGCHDVPGFEDAKPIGTGLADWGRKGTDKLAFEQISQYLTQGHGTAPSAGNGHGNAHADSASNAAGHDNIATAANYEASTPGAHSSTDSHSLNYEDMDPATGFFMEAVMNHERTGFIWQKLREPRSYDFKKTENKGYNERLRMPQFYFDQNQIESIITFVLGLVSEPPAAQYVYQGDQRRQAIANGLQIIEKYNCTGCHSFEMEKWRLAYGPDDFADPVTVKDYEFLEPRVSKAQLAASKKKDARGLMQATITGMPAVNDQTGKPVRFDEDGAPIEEDDKESRAFYSFSLYENAIVNGHVRQSGVQNLLVPEDRIAGRYPALGGYLARLIYPTVLADERKANPNVKAEEAWGWVPPPLHDEGRKVQTNWLHDFLLDPYKIRPAAVLRMPKFNMSSAEATALANYFAAVENASYPYEFDQRTRRGHLASMERENPNHLDDALKIVTDNNYCVKCHLIGDFEPTGSDRAKGPALDDVANRLRPDYVHDWVANPKRFLPYTGMPVNIPPDKPVSQDLYKGDSHDQLNALVDLLMNFDRYAERQTSIRRMIKAPPPGAEGADQPANTQATGERAGAPSSNERASLDIQNKSSATSATR
jgi:cytochrome c2